MTVSEYECWCGGCDYHWYLRLRGIDEPTPVVRCPRCNHDGVADELPPLSLTELPSEPS